MVIIILIIIAMQIIEAFTDYYIIQEAKGYGRKWHITDAVYYSLIMALIYIISDNLYIVLFMLVSRWFIFNTVLNLLRKKQVWYRGKKGFDHYIYKYRKVLWFLSIIVFLFNLILLIKQ